MSQTVTQQFLETLLAFPSAAMAGVQLDYHMQNAPQITFNVRSLAPNYFLVKVTSANSQYLVPNRYQQAINKHLGKISKIDAVFLETDDNEIVHIYSVVDEFKSNIYNRVMRKERLLEKEFPDTVFEFHLRAHQGRKPSAAVPPGSEPMFLR